MIDKKLEKELLNLNDIELLELSISKVEDYIIPIEQCSTIKKVSRQAINRAIREGILIKVEGITLESLRKYNVNGRSKMAGKMRALYLLDKKVKELEKENKELKETIKEKGEKDA